MPNVAVVQFRPRKGAYAENLARLEEIFRDLGAAEIPPDLVVLPETALTGYFLEGGVREHARTATQLFEELVAVHQASGAPPVDLIIGFYELYDTRLYNSALAATLGGSRTGIRHVHRKIFLPTYGVFDEERFVDPGREVRAFDFDWGRCGMLVCEDSWHSLLPTMVALEGAVLIVTVSASPARGPHPAQVGELPGKPVSVRRWERIAQQAAGEHGVYMVLAQLAGFEGGKALQGASVVAGPGGELLAEGPLFEEAVLRVEIDLDAIARARASAPMLSDLEMRLPFLSAQLSRVAHGGSTLPVVLTPGTRPPARLRGGLPAGNPLEIDPELTARWLVEFLREEVTRRRGFARAVVGLSGGIDSAVSAILAARALGADQVTAVRLPYRTSSPDSLAHAQEVIDLLGIRAETVDISDAVDGLAVRLAEPPSPARLGNIMARMRMISLFDRSAALQALPIGTGNKSERLLGYFTWHADDAPPVNPLGDLFKTQVRALARYLDVPEAILAKPASADLIAGQTDEQDFGITYERADLILHWLLQGQHEETIQDHGFSAQEIGLVRQRLDTTHWKRRLPTVAMISQTAIGEYYLRPVDY